MKKCTLVFLIDKKQNKILLAMKKRGFGVGKWNGVGGKLQNEETIQDTAVREAREEICVSIAKGDLLNVAIIDFFFENKPEFNQQVHAFFTEKWQNNPVESEEMKPQWFDFDKIPFDSMWIDDIHWLPRVLAGEKLKARFNFNESGFWIVDQDIVPVLDNASLF